MASTQDSSKAKQTLRPFGHPDLDFPKDHHLLITTNRQIHAWHHDEFVEYVSLKNGGIVAAKEAGNGSGLLAIADGWVIFLYDRQLEITRRWGLKGAYDRSILLRFANKSRELFYSTCLEDFIVRYSVEEDRILGYSCVHPSPPTVVAISATCKYIITASSKPPTIFLQEPDSSLGPISVRPHASDTLVTVAQFHPDREEIFLLAYADGTISTHTASRILLMRNSPTGSDGGIGHLKRVHQARHSQTNDGIDRVMSSRHYQPFDGTLISETPPNGVAAAQFMGGYKLRVVSIAGDGKCRIIDFERGAAILRTWYLHATCTSLAVFSPDGIPSSTGQGKDISRVNPSDHESPTSGQSGHIIAIGRTDGYIALYDALGLLWEEKLVSAIKSPIIDVEWVSDRRHEPRTPERTQRSQSRSGAVDIQWQFGSASRSDQDSGFRNPNSITRRAQKLGLGSPVRRSPSQSLGSPKRKCTEPPSERPPEAPQEDRTMPGGWISSSSSLSTPPTAKAQAMEFEIGQSSRVHQPPCMQLRNPTTEYCSPQTQILPIREPLHHRPQPKLPRARTLQSQRSPKKSASLQVSTPRANKARNNKTRQHNPWQLVSRSPEPEDSLVPGSQLQVTPGIPQKILNRTSTGPVPPSASPAQLARSRGNEWATEDDMATSKTTGKLPASSIIPETLTSPRTSFTLAPPNKPLPRPPSFDCDEYESLIGPNPIFSSPPSVLFPLPGGPPESPELRMKPLPDLPPAHGETERSRCSCDCADIIREEMAVWRAEVASLRKTIWVFGSGMGWDRLGGSVIDGTELRVGSNAHRHSAVGEDV